MYAGWTQLAFDSELREPLTPVDLGHRRLLAVRSADRVRVYDATCPHRGAHLGHGGVLRATATGKAVVECPFHGHRVHLGEDGGGPFRVAERPSVHAARGLFVLTDPAHDTGLGEFLTELERTHHVVEAFTIPVPITPEYVIENAFDVDHFAAVHALENRPELRISTGAASTLRVEGVFDMVRRNQWMREEADHSVTRSRFVARLFSPMLVASELGPADEPNVVLTAASPAPGGGSVVRVTLGLPRRRRDGPPTVRDVASLVSGSRTAFAQDIAVWEHLDTSATPRYTPADELVRAFRAHCERFREVVDGQPATNGARR